MSLSSIFYEENFFFKEQNSHGLYSHLWVIYMLSGLYLSMSSNQSHGLYIYLVGFLPKNTEVKTLLSYSPLSRRMGSQQGDMAT